MKKIYTIISLLFISIGSIQAQGNVGIGTNTPDASAKLDISSTDKGLLIPRVKLTSTIVAAPIVSPKNSLLIYNDTIAGVYPNNVTPGYYYWSVDKWVKFLAGNNNGLDIGYIVGWTSDIAPPDYLLPLTGGVYNWSDFPDFRTLNTDYPSKFIASSNATTFTLVNINTNGLFLRGNTTAGVNQDDATANSTAGLILNTTGNHNHTVDPASVSTGDAGNHNHGRGGTGDVGNGSFGLIQRSTGPNTVSSTDNTAGEPNVVVAPKDLGLAMDGNHNHTVDIPNTTSSISGEHTHTISGWDTETRPINTSVVWCLKVKSTSTSTSVTISNTVNTAINGLSVYGSAIGLGGNLNQNTTISQINNAFTLNNNGTSNTVFNLSSTGDFDIQDNGTSTFFVKDNGNVGINTNNPQQKLEVIGNISLPNSISNNSIYTWSPTDANWRIGMNILDASVGFTRSLATSHVQYLSYANGAGQGFAVGDKVTGLSSFETTGSGSGYNSFFRGNVGLGTPSPGYKLHALGDIYANGGWLRVSGNNGLYFESHGTGIHSVEADGGQYGSVSTFGNEGGWEGYSIAGNYVWMANGNQFGLYNDIDNRWCILMDRGINDNGFRFFNSNTGNTNMRIQHTNGTNYASYDGDSNWDFMSDKRLKENIENEKGILSRLLKLDVVNYNFINQERKYKEIGFIAQDVEQYFPSLVSESTDERYDFKVKSLGYSTFGVLAIGGLKELKVEKDEDIAKLNKQVVQLKEENTSLKTTLNDMEKRLKELESKLNAK